MIGCASIPYPYPEKRAGSVSPTNTSESPAFTEAEELAYIPAAQLDRLLKQQLNAEAGEIVAQLDAIKDNFQEFMYAMPTILVASSMDTRIAGREYKEMRRQQDGKQDVMNGLLGIFGIKRPQPSAMVATRAVPLLHAPGDSLALHYMVGIVDNGDGGQRAQLYERSPEGLNGKDIFYVAVDPYQLSSLEKLEEIKSTLFAHEQKRSYDEAGLKPGDLFALSMRPHIDKYGNPV